MTTLRPIILDGDVVEIDPLTPLDVVTLTSAQLREGMVLVDPDLDTPEACLDHRVRSLPRGRVEWMLLDLNTGRHFTYTFTTTRVPMIRVGAR